jgi:hypothetical protein
MKVCFKVFQSGSSSWESLFEQAATFASELGPRRLINISHSEGREGWIANGVVTVWYWNQEPKQRN